MKKIGILGTTGSIGKSAISILKEQKENFQIEFAHTHSNYEELFKIALEMNIKILVISNEKLKNKICDIPKEIKVFFGEKSLLSLIESSNCDIILNGISGSAGLIYSIKIIENKIDLALANKESLVMAGQIIKKMLEKSQSKILPVDSEHSAIFQSLEGHSIKEVKNIHITASGGSFRNIPLKDFDKITLKDALNHPTWSMGQKITIDSATMMNKALEVAEAHYLFDISFEQIKAVLHPQSIIHSMVEYLDGSIICQMSSPSMQLPILYAISHPKHIKSNLIKTNLFSLAKLEFGELEKERYPLYFYAKEILAQKGIFPTIINAANEAAVSLFLQEKICFMDIYRIVKNYVDSQNNKKECTLEEILFTNKKVYEEIINNYKSLLKKQIN